MEKADRVTEIKGRILSDGSIQADDWSRLMELVDAQLAEQAKPKRRRLGPPHPDAKLLSPDQVATILGCGRDTVDRMIEDHVLDAIPLRSGKRKKLWGIPRKAVERLIVMEWKKSNE